MTDIYFIRHAESDGTVADSRSRPLTARGRADRAKVTAFLSDKNIAAVYASPYVRAVETVAPFAENAGLGVVTAEGFRERGIGVWVKDFESYARAQWADFSYRLPNGESLAEVQARNVKALFRIVSSLKSKNAAVGSHGTALSTVINYFDPAFGFDRFMELVPKMPHAVLFRFDGGEFKEYREIDL